MKKNIINIIKEKLSITYKAVRFVFSINKSYLILVFIGELIGALKIIPYIYLLKIAVSLLTQKSLYGRYLSSILILLSIILLLELILGVINKLQSTQKTNLDFSIKDQMLEKNNLIDYYALSTEEYYILKTRALEGYEHGCIEQNITLVFLIISNVILLVGILFTISSLGFALLLPICITILVRVVSEYFDRSANYIRL